jgi:tetratricopeptide (TPR) repeat protein
VNYIDAQGQVQSQGRDDYEISGDDPGQRYITFLEKINWCTALYGLLRTESLRGIFPLLQHDIAAGDNLLLARLALLGTFIQLPEPLFSRDRPSAAQVETFAQRYGRLHVMGQFLNKGITLPYCNWVKAHCDAILSADMTNQEKNRLCDQTIRILLGRYQGNFITEISRAVDLILKGEFHKNWEDELVKKPIIQRPGLNKVLDFVRLAKLAQELNYALGLLPKLPGLNCALGAVYALLGRHDEALTLFEKELKHNPGFKQAQDYAAQYRGASKGGPT